MSNTSCKDVLVKEEISLDSLSSTDPTSKENESMEEDILRILDDFPCDPATFGEEVDIKDLVIEDYTSEEIDSAAKLLHLTADDPDGGSPNSEVVNTSDKKSGTRDDDGDHSDSASDIEIIYKRDASTPQKRPADPVKEPSTGEHYIVMTWNQDEAKTIIIDSNENPENDDGAIIISDSEEDEDCSGQGSGQSEIEAAEVLSENIEESTSAQTDENTFDKMLVKEEIIEVGRKASRKRKLTSDLKYHYYYFCLDCEVAQPGSKVPITLDIASHILERGHINFQPISEVFPDRGHVLVENITFNPKFNKKVCKSKKYPIEYFQVM